MYKRGAPPFVKRQRVRKFRERRTREQRPSVQPYEKKRVRLKKKKSFYSRIKLVNKFTVIKTAVAPKKSNEAKQKSQVGKTVEKV